MTNTRLLFDSSSWLAYFGGENLEEIQELRRMVEAPSLSRFTSAVSLFEIKRRMIREKEQRYDISSRLWFVKTSSEIVDLDSELFEEAADISIKYGLAMADAVIYTCAQKKGAELVTIDGDFRGLKGVRLLR